MVSDIRRLLVQLQDRGRYLEQLDSIIGYSWRVVSEGEASLSFVFRENGALIVSESGSVRNGQFEILLRAKSVILNYADNETLYKQRFIDEAVMVLQQDGTQEKFMVMVNEALIPDLDVIGYLDRTYLVPLQEETKKLREKAKLTREAASALTSFKLCEIHGVELLVWSETAAKRSSLFHNGDMITLGGNPAPDDVYDVLNRNCSIICENGVVKRVLQLNQYSLNSGKQLLIRRDYRFRKGGEAWLDSQPAPDGKYKVGFLQSIRVKNGLVV